MNRNIMEIGYILSHVEWKLVYVCACMLSHFSHVRLFATLWTIAHQAPLSMGFSRQDNWNGLPCPPPRDLPDQSLLCLHAMAGRFFTTSATW